MKSYLLGLDVGTGGTRAVLVGKAGSIISSATREHQPFASPHNGWAEQEPHCWWSAAAGAIRYCSAKAQVSDQDVVCGGVSGPMHGGVMLDDSYHAIRPTSTWRA